MSNQRLITLTFLGGAVIAGLTLKSVAVQVLTVTGWPDSLVLGLMNVSAVTGLLGGIVTFFVLLRNAKAVGFVDEVIVELKKVYWPPREETVNSSTVVLGVTLTLALSLALFDFIWAKVTGAFLFS